MRKKREEAKASQSQAVPLEGMVTPPHKVPPRGGAESSGCHLTWGCVYLLTYVYVLLLCVCVFLSFPLDMMNYPNKSK